MKKCQLRSPCPKCQSSDGLIFPGKGPHLAKLVCWECGKFQKWLTRSEAERAQRLELINPEV